MAKAAIDLAAMIKTDREKKDLTQKEYAEKVGVSETTLKKLLNGHETFSLSTLALFAKEFGIPSLTLHFFDPASTDELEKHQDILFIETLLSKEHPQVVRILRDHMEDDIKRIKNIIQSSKTTE